LGLFFGIFVRVYEDFLSCEPIGFKSALISMYDKFIRFSSANRLAPQISDQIPCAVYFSGYPSATASFSTKYKYCHRLRLQLTNYIYFYSLDWFFYSFPSYRGKMLKTTVQRNRWI